MTHLHVLTKGLHHLDAAIFVVVLHGACQLSVEVDCSQSRAAGRVLLRNLNVYKHYILEP